MLLLLFAAVLVLALASFTHASAPESILPALTLEEKLRLLSGSANIRGYTGFVNGIDRVGLPSLAMNDGPQGYRGLKGTSTAWPCAMALASTFWPELVHRVASATGREFKLKGANVFLGPGMNLARVPTCGRNFEYICGEDPLLGERMATAYIRGIQSNPGLMAMAKHLVNNEQETNRNTQNSLVDDETNWNMYYRPFLASVRQGGVGSVMCSYNMLNGQYTCENDVLLRKHLHKEMGFQGFVVSDWFATRSTVNSARAGLDVEMPFATFFTPEALKLALNAKRLNLTSIDDKVRRIVRTMHRFKLSANATTLQPRVNATSLEHAKLARFAAASSVVLLRNVNHTLPLSINAPALQRVVVLGDGGRDNVLFAGGGSGHVNPAYIVSPWEAVRNALAHTSTALDYYNTDAALALKPLVYAREEETTLLVFVGTSSTETKDRPTLALSERQYGLVDHALALGATRVVVCVTAPGAVLLDRFFHRVHAVTLQFLPGQAAGDGLADVLFGVVDPGGARLPITLPVRDNEVGMTPEQFPGVGLRVNYSERLDIGYRYYSKHAAVKPLLPFGFGLSYANLAYLGQTHWVLPREAIGIQVGFVNTAHATMGVTVVQVYVTRYPASAAGLALPTALVGFQRVQVKPWEINTAKLRISLRVNADAKEFISPLAIWHKGRYQVFPGRYTLAIGPDSATVWQEFQVLLL